MSVPTGTIGSVRSTPTILHLDMDAFFASVEQASKPSLRRKPVIVGGVGPRGVVATASYEARRAGVRSAMPTAQARRLCPHAAFLTPRFPVYREISDTVRGLLEELSPLVEPLSLDEAFVDLAATPAATGAAESQAVGAYLRSRIRAATGLTASVGLAGSKMLAKIASEQAKPDGLVLIEPGTERELLAPLPVRTLPGIGPATDALLRRAGIATAGDAVRAGETELVRLLGTAQGSSVHAMAQGIDERPVIAERESKSVSAEETFDADVTDPVRIRAEAVRLAGRCASRLRVVGRSGRTVVVKVRRYDFATLTRSDTLPGPTDDPAVIREAALRLLAAVDTTAGIRLLGVGVTALADFTQEDLFAQAALAAPTPPGPPPDTTAGHGPSGRRGQPPPRWRPGLDVSHERYGPGWVQGSGLGRVTVRFERPDSPPGTVRTFATDDPALTPSDPLPLAAQPAPGGTEYPGASPPGTSSP